MYFNNVETPPGVGYPRNWETKRNGRAAGLSIKAVIWLFYGSKGASIDEFVHHPEQPEITDYFEPWTYDYETLIHSGRKIINL